MNRDLSEISDSQPEAGSFRDRHARVVYRRGQVLRVLNDKALADWRRLASTTFFSRLQAEGKIVATEELPPGEAASLGQGWAGALRHQRIPFVSYPYEWPFSMLRDAALLHLELCLSGLEEGMILKDSSSYNVQWFGTHPTFIDLLSFETLPPGQPWAGYRQFCQLFLYPLFLQAYKNLPYQPWLRGNIEGVEAHSCRQAMSFRDWFRPGVFTHVFLQSKLQSSFSNANVDARKELSSAGFNKEMIRANLIKLRKLVSGLKWSQSHSQWSAYTSRCSYSERDEEDKATFVKNALSERRIGLVWDLGCNTGKFAELAAQNSEYVVAMDADHLAVELLYQRLKERDHSRILPIVNNIADPSPNLGWRGTERKSLPNRGRPDLILCLALVHHMVIAANIPMQEFVQWLAGLGGELVVEFVSKDDPMAQKLLRNKEDQYQEYTLENFQSCLERNFTIRRKLELSSGSRFLFDCIAAQSNPNAG